MNSNDVFSQLEKIYSGYEWYDSVGTDKFGRYVVYVKFMNEMTMALSNIYFDGKPVVAQFAVSKPEVIKAKYGTVKTLAELNLRPYAPIVVAPKPVEKEPLDDSALDDLIFELDRLERLCGSKSLQDIFYETHDGKNAVTNVSDKYPYVRSCMEKLYNNFGFDVIYDELDG